jgi:serine/threonine protein kinase
MLLSGDPGWMDRISESLSEHEERHESLQDAPPRYEILGEISRGGMGIVYRAWDPQLGREVALKVLSAEDGNTAEAHERFEREARLAAGLHHPNIVPVHDTGTWNGRDYIAMQLVDGTTLDAAKADLRTSLACVRDAARALHYAHEQGIVHRDIKPSNLLLDRQGRIFVTDFGVARQMQVAANLTNPGCVVGTPAYMSPEQAQGLLTDSRSDVYSLGATLYELATGRPPYSGKDPIQIVEAVRAQAPPPPRRLSPDLSKNVEAIILGAMERRCEERYATAAELADDIDRYLSGERPLRRPRGTAYEVRRQFVRHPWRSTAAIVFCALLLMAGALLGYLIRGYVSLNRARQEPDRDLKKSYYKKAAPFFAEAEQALEEMNQEDRTLAATAAAEAKKQQEQLRAQTVVVSRKAEIETKRAAVLEAITKKSIPDLRAALDALKGAAPEKYEEHLPRLRELEFDAGIEELERLPAIAGFDTFRKRYLALAGPDYLQQNNRNARLARPVMQHALHLAAARRFDDAVVWFNEVEKLGVRDSALHHHRGLARMELEHWDDAQRDLAQLLQAKASPDARFARLPYRRGRLAMAGKWWPEAIKEFDAALAIDPRLAVAYHDRALARFRIQGLAREALEGDLKTALDLDPGMKPTFEYRDLALAYSRTEVERHWGLDKEADRTAAWTKVLGWLTLFLERSSGNDPDLLLERARMHRRLGNLPLAIEDARKSLDMRDSAEGTATLGMLLYLQANVNKDPKTMEEAAGRLQDPYWKGLCRRYRGELEPAMTLFLEAKPPSAHASLQLARIRLDLVGKGQEWRDAADDAARALAAASTLTEAEYVGGLYEHQKVPRSEAIRLLTRDAHLVRGQAAFEGSDYALCIEECKAALALEPRFPSAFLWRGYARCKAKQHREAQDDFKETIRITAHPGEKENATLWLDRCTKHQKD